MKKHTLPFFLASVIIILTATLILLSKNTCIFDSYDYVDDQSPLLNKLKQEIILTGFPHYFKDSYWLESDNERICITINHFNQNELIEQFQNYAKKNTKSDIKSEIKLKGIVKKDSRCFLPCPNNSVTQLKCDEEKIKELHYCVKVIEILD